MASLSNINGLFDVHSTGAILFSTSHGTSGQILKSNGNAAPTWVAASTVIGGPYLPLTGGTLTGPLSGTSATFAGMITVNGGGIDIDNNDDVRLRFDNASTFMAGLQVATTAGDMISSTAINDFAIRSQANLIFSSGGNTERMRIDQTHGDKTFISSYSGGTFPLRVGYGTFASFTPTFVIADTGNVGIGVTDPGAKLHNYSTVSTDVWISGYGTLAQNNWRAGHAIFAAQGNGLLISKANAANNTNRLFLFYNNPSGYASYYMYKGDSTAVVKLDTDGDSYLNGGNVGIGTTSPSSYDAEADDLVIYNAVTPGITIALPQTTAAGSARGSILFSDGTSGNEKYRGGVIYDHGTGMGGVADTMYIRSAVNNYMVLGPTGNVGIGTKTPGSKLSIRNNGVQLSLQRADTLGTEWKFYSWTSGLNIFPVAASEIYIGRDGATTNLQLHNGILKVLGTGDSYFTGNVGIGVTGPSQKLHVVGNIKTFGNIFLQSNANGFRTVALDTTNGADNQELYLCGGATASSTRGGQVGVYGNEVSGAGGSVVIVAGNVSTGDIDFLTANTQRMRISNVGRVNISNKPNSGLGYAVLIDVGTGATGDVGYQTLSQLNTNLAGASDIRFKKNIEIIPNAIKKIKTINGYTFDWDSENEDYNYSEKEGRDAGIIAQEIQKVLPEIVQIATVDRDEEGKSTSGKNYLSVDYKKIIPLLIQGIKEQETSIQELKAEIEILKNK